MKYGMLEKQGWKISELGFGCMSLNVKDPNSGQLLNEAFEQGINYFDTADLYQNGLNEALVGKALSDVRDQVIIATKVGNQMRSDGKSWDWNPTKDYILTAVENSLKRLGTDYIDLYQLHGGTIDDPTDETIEAFEILLQQGKIRAYGISSIRPNVIRKWVEKSNLSSNMMQYNLLDVRPEEEALDFLHSNHVGVMIRGVVARGLLAGKQAEAYLNHDVEYVTELLSEMDQMDTMRQRLAMKYALAHNATTSIILGMRTGEQLKCAVDVMSTPSLSSEELSQLKSFIKPNFYTHHR